MEMSAKSREGTVPDEAFPEDSEMAALIRARDWTATVLGAVENWPQSLRTASSICLASSFPAIVWWGTDLVALYNDACRPLLETSKHPQGLGQRGRDCWPEIWPVVGPAIAGVLATGEAIQLGDRAIGLDRNGGTEQRYFTFSCSPIRDESGGVGGVFTAVTETTQRVIAERRLSACGDRACPPACSHLPTFAPSALNAEAAAERLAVILESLTDGLAFFDRQLRYTHANRAAALLLCKEPEELLGKTIGEVFPEAIAQTFYEQSSKVLAEQAVVEFEEFFPPLDIWLKIRAHPSKEGLAVYFRDITQCKQSEEKLQRWQQQFKILAENASHIIALLDAEERYLDANRSVEHATGQSAEYFIGKTIEELGVAEEISAFWREKVRGGVELRRQKKDGSPLEIGVWETPAPDAEDDIGSTMAPIEELRDSLLHRFASRKRSEEALRKERDFTTAILNTIESLVVVLDRKGRIVSFNRACEKITGYKFEEIKNAFVWDFFVVPEEKEPVQSVFDNLRDGNFPNEHENYWLTRDGKRRLIAWSNTVMLDEIGQVEYVIGTGIDITERRQTERALGQSEVKFRRLAESNLIGIFFCRF